jgi:hypothetical protein
VILATDVARSLAGPFLAACALLVIAGAGKIAHPIPARIAARAAGMRVSRSGIVVFGVVEIAAGVSGALVGGRAALAVAACYLLLAAVAVALLIRAPATPCACLGSSSAVVTRTHVVLNLGAAAFAVAAAGGGSPLGVLSDQLIAGAVIAVLAACAVRLAMLALETLPEVTAAIQEGHPST